MDTSNYTFRIHYIDGLQIEVIDFTDKTSQFLCRVFIKKQKVNSRLEWNYSSAGSKWIEEEFVNAEDFLISWGENTIRSHQYYKYFYKGLAPYHIKIYKKVDEGEDELIHEEDFDPRHKLINFTLHSDNPETLHTWVCVIDKFKKENNCQISITNSILKETQPYDFVDAYFDPEEKYDRYYAGYEIGRFGDENAPNLYRNPDGIQGKNDLEIIEDILYHYTTKL
jgi:hypothetical protein